MKIEITPSDLESCGSLVIDFPDDFHVEASRGLIKFRPVLKDNYERPPAPSQNRHPSFIEW